MSSFFVGEKIIYIRLSRMFSQNKARWYVTFRLRNSSELGRTHVIIGRQKPWAGVWKTMAYTTWWVWGLGLSIWELQNRKHKISSIIYRKNHMLSNSQLILGGGYLEKKTYLPLWPPPAPYRTPREAAANPRRHFFCFFPLLLCTTCDLHVHHFLAINQWIFGLLVGHTVDG